MNDNLRFLKKEKEISDQIFNHSRSMISIINRKYIYERVNSTFCKIFRAEVDSIVGKSLSDIWGDDTFNKLLKKNIDYCFEGKTLSYEASFSTPGSGKRFFDVTFHPITLDSGEINHLMVETCDINDLKRSEKFAREKEKEFRQFETNLPIGFLRCDVEGNILQANKAFLRIMDYPDEEIVKSMNIKDFYLDERFFEIHFDQLREFTTKIFGRVYLKNSAGNEIPCRISGLLAFNEMGRPVYIDFAVEDSSRELMLENRLLQAQKLETIGALAGGIAHDFNNILATISGYAELLQEDLPKETALADKVSKIRSAVVKAKSITNQILTFSRHVEQEMIPVNVSEVLKETIGFVRMAIPVNITVRSSIPRKTVNVLADPTQLFRVFLNLMTNAIQAMEDVGGVLSVKLEVLEKKHVRHEINKDIVADEYALFTFQDTGRGMDPTLIGRIFEPFFTTRDVGKGTGLGLSVVHGIIAEMEGEIFVSSRKKMGSVFYVYLPVSRNYSEISGQNTKRKKILFITGNKYESAILSLAIENSGFDLLYVSDQQQLLKVLSYEGERPDLIIYMSDSKLIQQEDLVSIFTNLKITTPCLLITDPNKELLEEKILNSGIIKQHLIKPVSLKEIRNAIQISLK